VSASSPPRLRFKSYDEMNAWLVDKCISHAKSHHHHSTAQHGLTAFVARDPKRGPSVQALRAGR